jgi:uncharacterized protein GlcG (DUF336 family)
MKIVSLSVLLLLSAQAFANTCKDLPSYTTLKSALDAAVKEETSGLDFDMWATIVDRDGTVCAVAFSGTDRGAQWPGSRVISAQKANTANAFGLDKQALSTANLYSAVQPGGSLFGLQHSNPVNTQVAYQGNSAKIGTAKDPMVGSKIGGVNVFGGGLGLYKVNKITGGLGLSGDTSCADHMIAWRVRNKLNLDEMAKVGGVSGDTTHPDNIIFDELNGNKNKATDGFEQADCLNTKKDGKWITDPTKDLPKVK